MRTVAMWRGTDLCACMCRRGHRVPPREEAGEGVVERPFPPQRIHNFPLRGRGTPGLRQGHNAPFPPGAHRSPRGQNAERVEREIWACTHHVTKSTRHSSSVVATCVCVGTFPYLCRRQTGTRVLPPSARRTPSGTRRTGATLPCPILPLWWRGAGRRGGKWGRVWRRKRRGTR